MFEEFYHHYRKASKYLYHNIKGIRDEERKEEFTNNFMIQMLILWSIQEKGFFNKDKNYFITKFKEIQRNNSKVGHENYFDFLVYFLEKIYSHLDSNFFHDPFCGKIVVPEPAIFLDVDEYFGGISIPDHCFYNEEITDILTSSHSGKGNADFPVFNFFESKINKFNGFILGGIYENLFTQTEKKRTGSYYTPETITNYLCKTTIETYLIENVNNKFNTEIETLDLIIKSHDERMIEYLLQQLQELKVLDPAVGTGHFLETACNLLLEIYVKIWQISKTFELKKGLEVIIPDGNGDFITTNLLEISDEFSFKFHTLKHFIFPRNIYGIDTNPKVLKLTRARLFLLLTMYINVHKYQFTNNLDIYFNLKEGNSLVGYKQLEMSDSSKQMKLESYFTEIIPNSLIKSIEVKSELKEHLQEAINALNIEGDLIKEVEHLNLILSQKEISNLNIKNVLTTRNKLFLILLASLNTQFSKKLRVVLIGITDLINNKLDEKFSSEYCIDLNQLKQVKTFHWICDFSNVFLKEGGFDVIVANPPYLGESGNKELFRIYAKALKEYYEGKMDLWYFFLHRSLDLMVNHAYSSFITSSYWVTATGALKLRARLLSDTFLVQYINFGENKVFGTAKGVHTNTITFKKSNKSNNNVECILFDTNYPLKVDPFLKLKEQIKFKTNQEKLTFENWDQYFHFLPKKIRPVLDYITTHSKMLKDKGFFVKEGIVTGLNKLSLKQIREYKLSSDLAGTGVFILDKENLQDLELIKSLSQEEKVHLKPFYKNSDISRYHTTFITKKNILYLNRNIVKIKSLPRIKKHLQRFHEILERSLDNPPYINRPRTQSIFPSPKIVTPQRSIKNCFAYNSFNWYAAQDVYYILNEENDREKLKSLLLILNSKFAYFWLFWMGKRKGMQLELFGEPLGYFPINQDFDKYSVLAIISDYLLFLHSIITERTELKGTISYFDEKVADSLVYEVYFKEKFCKERLDSSKDLAFLEVISKELKSIEYDQWVELYYREQSKKGLNHDEKLQLETLEKENLKIINDCHTFLKTNKQIQDYMVQIKENPFVKTIEARI